MLLHCPKRKRIFLPAGFVIVAIGVAYPSPVFAEGVQEFVRNFVSHSQKYSQVVSLDPLERSEVSIRFTHLDSWVHGQCTDSPVRQEILINGTYWNELDSFQREMLVYHELGHCVLKREHIDSTESFGGHVLPTSIMHPHILYLISEEAFRPRSDFYFAELFGQKPNQPFVAYVREGFFGGDVSSAIQSLIGNWPKALAW